MTDQELMRHFGKDKDIAALLGITVQAVGQWKRNGMPYAVRKFLELRIERDELLEAAKAALQVFVNQGWDDDLVAAKSLSAAIAKATGGNT